MISVHLIASGRTMSVSCARSVPPQCRLREVTLVGYDSAVTRMGVVLVFGDASSGPGAPWELLTRNALIAPLCRRPLEICVDGSEFCLPRRAASADDGVSALSDLVVAHLRQSRTLIAFTGRGQPSLGCGSDQELADSPRLAPRTDAFSRCTAIVLWRLRIARAA
jgi:hypothetical protein